MIGRILKFGILLVIGIVAYNYFLGTPEEKAKSKEIIGKVSDIGKAGVGLIREEVQKFKDGKYDRALDKIHNGLVKAKEEVQDKGGKLMEGIEDWEGKKERWEAEKERLKELFDSATKEEQEQLEEEIRELNEEGALLRRKESGWRKQLVGKLWGLGTVA